MSYETGIAAITNTIKRAKERSEGSNGPQAQLFQWKDGDRKIIWFMDDSQIVTIYRHEWVPCSDGKNHHFACAEKLNTPRECPIRDEDGKHPYPRELCVAQVAWLKEFPTSTEGGRVMRPEFVDYEGERYKDADDKDSWLPGIWIVCQAPKNFWSIFESYAIRNGKLDDQPYEVERKGGDAQTLYVPIPYFTSNTEEQVKKVLIEEVKKKLSKALAQAVTPIEWNERMGAASRFDYYFNKKSDSELVGSTEKVEVVNGTIEIKSEKKESSGSLRSQLLDYQDEPPF